MKQAKLEADERRKRLEQARRSPPASRAPLTTSTVTTTAERLLQQNEHITAVEEDNSRLACEFSELAAYAAQLKDKLKRAQASVISQPAAALLAREAAVGKQLTYTQQQLRDAHAKIHRLESSNASTRSELQYRLQQHETHLERLIEELTAKVAAYRLGPPSPSENGNGNGQATLNRADSAMGENHTKHASSLSEKEAGSNGLMVVLKKTFGMSGDGGESPRVVTETLELESQLKKYKFALKDLNSKLVGLQTTDGCVDPAAALLSVNDVALVEVHQRPRGCCE